MSKRDIKFEYGFESVNGIVKKVYYLHEIPKIEQKCDVWNMLPIKYVRQFTGLIDKDGVEIYEGDIVEFNQYGLHKCVVEWNARAYAFVLKSPSYGKEHTKLSGRGKLKVIGNIHSNPELL